MARFSWQELLQTPGSERHIVQIYRDEPFLRDAVAAWVAPALEGGGGVILICAPHNAALVLGALRERGVDTDGPLACGRLVIVDARPFMARFIMDGMPDGARFHALASEALARLRAALPSPEGEVRAWGEMVNLLWQEGNPDAARRLEALWNEVIDAHGIRLLCSYRMDNLDPHTHEGALRDVCGSHSQLVPEADYEAFESALNDALVDVLGEEEAMAARFSYARRRSMPTGMPTAEAILVALQELRPEAGRLVLQRARERLAQAAAPGR